MQLTLSSFMIITSYLVTTLLVSCVLVNGSVSWYSGQQARHAIVSRGGGAFPGALLLIQGLYCSAVVKFMILTLLLAQVHSQGNLAEQQHMAGSLPALRICQAGQSLLPTVQVEVGYLQPQTHLNLQLLPSVFSLPPLPRSMKMF